MPAIEKTALVSPLMESISAWHPSSVRAGSGMARLLALVLGGKPEAPDREGYPRRGQINQKPVDVHHSPLLSSAPVKNNITVTASIQQIRSTTDVVAEDSEKKSVAAATIHPAADSVWQYRA